MSLFQCQKCGCAESTALSAQGIGKHTHDWYDWTGIEGRRGLLLCSACAPMKFSDGDDSGLGEWHGRFDRVFLPMGVFHTNKKGNLEHIEGSTDFEKFAIDSKG